jgi:hypothetical protein
VVVDGVVKSLGVSLGAVTPIAGSISAQIYFPRYHLLNNVIWAPFLPREPGSRGGPAGRDERFPFNRGGFCSNRYCTMWSRLHCWRLVPCERFRGYESYVLPRAINTTGCAARVADFNENCSYETPEQRITKLGVKKPSPNLVCGENCSPTSRQPQNTTGCVQGQTDHYTWRRVT